MKKRTIILLIFLLLIWSTSVFAERASKYGETNVTAKEDYEELSIGSQGDSVITLQERLIELGFTVGEVDGIFGKKTESAVKAFQELNELEITGIVGEKTYECLYSEDVIQATPVPTPTPTPKPVPTATPKLYSKSECVEAGLNTFKINHAFELAKIETVKSEVRPTVVEINLQYKTLKGETKVYTAFIDRETKNTYYSTWGLGTLR